MLCIAGVEFNIHLNQILLPVQDYINPGYRHFFSRIPLIPPTNSIDVEIMHDAGPDISRMQHKFKGSDAWKIFSCYDENFIVYEIPDCKHPLWTAKIQFNELKVTIYCSSDMFDNKLHRLMFNPLTYPLDQILMMYFLADHNGAIFHSAGWLYKGKCCIFPGRSGAGKSTLSRLILGHPGPGIEPLSDDRMVVRKIDGVFHAFGTPWPGDAGIAVNKRAPLKGIFFIHQGAENRIREITPQQAFERLMPVTSIPWYDREVMPRILDFCDDLLRKVPAYQLTFMPDEDAVNMLIGFVQ